MRQCIMKVMMLMMSVFVIAVLVVEVDAGVSRGRNGNRSGSDDDWMRMMMESTMPMTSVSLMNARRTRSTLSIMDEMTLTAMSGDGMWVLAERGQTCGVACATLEMECDASKPSELDTNKKLADALAEVGQKCNTFVRPKSFAGAPYTTGFKKGRKSSRNYRCAPILPNHIAFCDAISRKYIQPLCYCVQRENDDNDNPLIPPTSTPTPTPTPMPPVVDEPGPFPPGLPQVSPCSGGGKCSTERGFSSFRFNWEGETRYFSIYIPERIASSSSLSTRRPVLLHFGTCTQKRLIYYSCGNRIMSHDGRIMSHDV